MLEFKPSKVSGDLVDESSDDLEGVLDNSDDSDDSDGSDSDDIDVEEIAGNGEEPGKSNNKKNPFSPVMRAMFLTRVMNLIWRMRNYGMIRNLKLMKSMI